MNVISVINRISALRSGKPPTKKMLGAAISTLFAYTPQNLNGFEHAERIGLTLALHGQDKIADKILEISRAIPSEHAKILLLVLLSADLESIVKRKGPKRDPVGKPIVSMFDNLMEISDIGQRALVHAPVPSQETSMPPPEQEMTFEAFMQKRFSDVRSDKVLFINHTATPKVIESLLSGKATDISDVVDGKIEQTRKARFEYHTLSSTQVLLDKFIDIGNARIQLMRLLRKDSLSYEVRRHLTKFDAYVSVLADNSPAAILTKIRPFGQVCQWLCRLLSLPTFSLVHKELLASSQTHFKRDLSLRFWAAAFEEEARPLYTYAFMVNDKPNPVFAEVMKPAEYDCLAAGKLLRFLHDAVPSHPLFELAEDFQERFLSLQNVIKLYESKCNRAINRIKNEWIDYHKRINDEKTKKFNAEIENIRSILKQQEMETILRQKEIKEEKQEKLRKLQEELNEYDVQRRKREREEQEQDKAYLDEVVSQNAATPFFRPTSDEEKKLIELEKLDMFREFQEQMRELGASEEQIMQFFPELNLPMDEIEALGKEYEHKPEYEVAQEVLDNLPPMPEIKFTDEVKDELKDIAGFALGKGFSSDDEENEPASAPASPRRPEPIPAQSPQREKPATPEHKSPVKRVPHNSFVEQSFREEIEGETGREEDDESIQGAPLTTIPALFHRLIIPTFKLQHRMVSKALFTILKYRNNLPEQMRALSSLFLVIPSPHVDAFLKRFCAIPYSELSFMLIGRAFKESAANLHLDADVKIGQATDPPLSVADLLDRVNHMPIEVKMNPIFSLMLPDRILECYVTLFRILLLLKLARAAVDKLWYLARDSYTHKPDMKACAFMSRFVVATETYFYNVALATTSKSILEICDDVETIDECNAKHEKALVHLMKLAMVTANTAAIRTPLLQALVEVCRYAFGPLMMEKGITPSIFLSSANKLATIVHELRTAMSDNQTFRFLDTLFVAFMQ